MKALKKEECDVKTVFKDVNSMFKKDKDPILTSELSLMIADGHFQLFDVEKEPEKGFCWSGLWCFLIGVAQVVGGVALCTFAPAFGNIGMNLIMEGISDCYEGIKGMATGVFSWVQWAISKAISLAVSVLAFGINKSFKWFKEGGNLVKGSASKVAARFTTTGAKQSLKQALKYTAKQAVVTTAVHFVGEGFDYALKKAFEEIFVDLKRSVKEKIEKSKEVTHLLLSFWLQQSNNENVNHRTHEDIMKNVAFIVTAIFDKVQKYSPCWNTFTEQLQRYSSPLMDLADKTVFKGKTSYGAMANKIIQTASGISKAIVGGQELYKLSQNLEQFLTSELRESLKIEEPLSKGSTKEKAENDKVMNYIKTEQSKISELFSVEFHQRVTSVSTSLVNDTMKSFAMNKVNKTISEVTKLHKNEGYFREKKHDHKMFHTEAKKKEVDRNKDTKKGIIEGKEGKPCDHIDLRALDDHTNKAIVIEVYDEKGKKVKEDRSSNKKEEIRIRLTRKKQKDGTYVGHYEYVDKDGNVRENYGGNQTCLYQAVYQAESSEQQSQERIVQGAADLRKEALKRMDSSLLVSLDQRRQVYRASAGPSGKFSLEGGLKRSPTTNNPQELERIQRRLQRDGNKRTVEKALEVHIAERIEGLAEAYKLAKQACPELSFDKMFQEPANLQNGIGSRTRGKVDIHEQDASKTGESKVNDFNNIDAAHTVSLGLKDVPENKIKDKVAFAQLKEKLAHTNLLPQFYNITFDRKVDEAQFHEMRRQFDSGSFNKEAFKKHAHDLVQEYGASQQERLGSLRQTEAIKRKIKLFEKSTRLYRDQLKPSNSTKRVRKP